MEKVYLVTGGAGFIGSHLVDHLVQLGKKVRVLDNLSTGLQSNLTNVRDKIEFIDGSITDEKAIEYSIRNCTHVFHLAALASVARSVENPLATHEACVTGTLKLLDQARKQGVKRVVYAASSSAYGGASDNRLSQQEGSGAQIETQLPMAMSPYAAAKLAGEYYLQAFANTYGLETVRLRFFNIFGPRQRSDSPYSGVIALFVRQMLANQQPIIFGDGLQSRDFTFVQNAVSALYLAAIVPGVSGKVYNVGTGRGVNLLQLVQNLNQILGRHLQPTHEKDRLGDVRYSCADITRIQADLGYEPIVLFDEGLKRTVEWCKSTQADTVVLPKRKSA